MQHFTSRNIEIEFVGRQSSDLLGNLGPLTAFNYSNVPPTTRGANDGLMDMLFGSEKKEISISSR